MVELAHPWALVALIPLAVLWLLGGRVQPPAITYFLGDPKARAPKGRRGSFPHRRVRGVALALLVVLLSGPRTRKAVPPPPHEGLAMVVALDVSGSMALDGGEEGSRLDMAKSEVSRFIEARPFDHIGLVTFGDGAVTRVPPTTRHDHLLEVLSDVRVESRDEGTALGMGLGLAAYSALEVPSPSRVVLLLTDGRSNRGTVEPLSAADAAGALGIRIHAIGVGGAQGEDPLDENLLHSLVQRAEGRFFRAADAVGLREVLASLGSMETAPLTEAAGFTFESHHKGLILTVLLLLSLEAIGRSLPGGRLG